MYARHALGCGGCASGCPDDTTTAPVTIPATTISPVGMYLLLFALGLIVGKATDRGRTS